jgi:hypothetical protein
MGSNAVYGDRQRLSADDDVQAAERGQAFQGNPSVCRWIAPAGSPSSSGTGIAREPFASAWLI